MSENRVYRFFRLVDGKRVPCVMELDSSMLVVKETLETEGLDHVARGRSVLQETPEEDSTRLVSRWVTRSVSKNPISGTEELRQRYFKELDDLHAKHAEQGTECPGCELGTLIRKHRAILKESGFL